jgi:type VI secretion system secreted protein VgrG
MSPTSDLKASRSDPKSHALSEFEIFDYPGEYWEQEDGETYARLRLESVQWDYALFRAETYARGLGAGDLFSLSSHPRSDQNQQYLIVSADYEMTSDSFQSVSVERDAPVFRAKLSGIDSQAQFRPAIVTPKPVVRGPQSATVVGQSGEEIWTDQYGRVKVQFHWDRYGKSDENSSCWIRVAHPWAGKGWGGIHVPRIGQEVVVDFLEGDPDRPLIIGRVYNADQKVPFNLPDQAVISGFKTSTTKGGEGYNQLTMDDTEGQEMITIHAQYDMSTTVEHDDTQIIKNDRTINVDGKHTETIQGDTAITVSEGDYSRDVSSGKAALHVKGAVNETFDNSLTTTVTDKVLITSQGAEIELDAGTKIVLKTGASTLSMSADGTIELSGVSVKISGETVSSSAAVSNKITGTMVEIN